MTRIFALVLLFVALPLRAEETVLKVATLAPEGSTWWKAFQDADKRLKDLSGGRLRIRIYAGGVAGDEPDVVRKMRIGSLHGGALTSVGLAEIQPAVLALQAPALFDTWEELDAARKKLADRLRGLLAEKGFVVLTWGDVGFSRLFSATRVTTPADLKNGKWWLWTQDGVYRAWYDMAGIKPVPLGVPDVLPSLQTGIIDAFSSAPLAAVSLQWFSRAKYMMDTPISVTIGAIVLTQKSLDKLTPADRALVLQAGEEISGPLASAVRADNDRSIEAIQKAGLQITALDANAKKAWQELGIRAADAAADKVYPKALLNEIREAVRGVRAAK